MDLAGKAWGVPCWQMLGGKFRDRVRLYADTTHAEDPKEQGKKLKERMDRGITYLKQDFGIELLEGKPGMLSKPLGDPTLAAADASCIRSPASRSPTRASRTSPTGSGQVREVIGMEIPLSSDHYGHIGVNSCIRLARAMEKWNLAWMEDMVPWQFGELMKQIQDSTTIADPDRRGHLPEGGLHQADRHGRGGHDPPGPRQPRRADRDQEDRRLRDGARRGDGHALRRHAGLVHGQRALRRRHRELHRPRAPLARRAVVGEPGDTTGGKPLVERDSRSCRTARASASSSTRRSSRRTCGRAAATSSRRPQWDNERGNDRLWS